MGDRVADVSASLSVICAAALAMSLVVVAVAAAPADPHEAAGVFPPWWSAGQALTAASRAGASDGCTNMTIILKAQAKKY